MRFERFSERCGYVKVDEALQVERMSEGLKNLLWNCIYDFIKNVDGPSYPSKVFMKYVFQYWWKQPYNDIPYDYWDRHGMIKNRYETFQWHEVYDTVEFVVFFHSNTNMGNIRKFTIEVNEILERERSGYRLVDGLVTPITDENEIESIKEAIEENLLDTAKIHIQESLNMLSDREHPNYRNSIKESISAVEAVCRYITNESTLDKALPKLKNKGIIIPDMLEDGMKKIYYFTNGESGIRHALMDESININFEEAKYMLVVCSAFVNYLKAKQGKANDE